MTDTSCLVRCPPSSRLQVDLHVNKGLLFTNSFKLTVHHHHHHFTQEEVTISMDGRRDKKVSETGSFDEQARQTTPVGEGNKSKPMVIAVLSMGNARVAIVKEIQLS